MPPTTCWRDPVTHPTFLIARRQKTAAYLKLQFTPASLEAWALSSERLGPFASQWQR